MSSMMERWGKVLSVPVAGKAKAGTVKPEPVKKPEVIALDDEELEHRRHMRQVEFDLNAAKTYTDKSNNARSANHSFSLTLADWSILVSQKTCAYSGRHFTSGNDKDYRTMERIDPFIGYTPENTIAVTYSANQEKAKLDAFMKGDVILDEVKLKLLRKAVYKIEKKLKIKKGK